jgi:hypothetical protein
MLKAQLTVTFALASPNRGGVRERVKSRSMKKLVNWQCIWGSLTEGFYFALWPQCEVEPPVLTLQGTKFTASVGMPSLPGWKSCEWSLEYWLQISNLELLGGTKL